MNSESIKWEDSNKEVVYKGILYDVISIHNKGMQVVLTVISDIQETELKKDFASLYQSNSLTSKHQPFELLKNFFSLKYVVNVFGFNYSASATTIELPVYFFQLSSIFFELDTPPPTCFA